jgi:hypothetical protein
VQQTHRLQHLVVLVVLVAVERGVMDILPQPMGLLEMPIRAAVAVAAEQ